MPWRDLIAFKERFTLEIGGDLTAKQIFGLLSARGYQTNKDIHWNLWRTLPRPKEMFTIQSFAVKRDFFLYEVVKAAIEAVGENDERIIILPREAPIYFALARAGGEKWDPQQFLLSEPVVQPRRQALQRSHWLILSDFCLSATKATIERRFSKEIIVNIAVADDYK